MRVLVVGGTGFLGPRVVTRLSNLGHHVTVYHRGEHEARLPFGVRHVHAAGAAPPIVSFPDELTELAWDVVLAMAPIGEADSSALMRTFLGIARRLVALSSGDVYRAYGVFSGSESGPPDPRPLDEDSALREKLFPYRGMPGLPDHLADYDKILVERIVRSDPAMPGTILRLPAVYGPGDRQHRFGATCRRIADRRPAILFGRAQAAFRWTHGFVDDVAEAIVLAVTTERARGRVYNVGEETTPTMAERVEAFGRALEWEGRVVALDEARLPPHLATPGNFDQPISYDTGRIRRELDWREITPPDTAFRRTAEWEKESGVGTPSPDYALEDAAVAAAAVPSRRP
ncbi:MAG: NAD-dependent epimerase/dehydratase family protein [Acidobacteria bacterium]|nr:NAD-dependent epimerase/dehydratase family protein [Acidobacteriota bacterium]MCA1609563.1 NAD-dependent epimerase/dehydratase family protein [Acidobacteriota bacterium]